MFTFSYLRQITNTEDRQKFSQQYEAHSGLPIPDHYLLADSSRVFGFYVGEELIGGFILASGQQLRTVELFAQPENQATVYQNIGSDLRYSEICCLWMAHAYRKNTWINTLNWIAMGWAVKKYALPNILFGTCSAGLARVYASSKTAQMVSRDRVNRRRTYIFRAEKKYSITGFTNIIKAKLLKRYQGPKKRVLVGQ